MARMDRIQKVRSSGRMKKKVKFALPDDAIVVQVLEQGSPTPLARKTAKGKEKTASSSTRAKAALAQEQAQRTAPSSINDNSAPAIVE